MEKTQDEFLKSVKQDEMKLDDDKAFGDLVDKPAPQAEQAEPEKDEETPKTRKFRRMEEKYQKEREANIALNARLQALSELDSYAKENKDEIDPDLVKAFGTTPEGKTFVEIMTKKLREVEESAQEKAYNRLQEARDRENSEAAQESSIIDQEFESIEDKFNVDLSGETKASKALRNGFIDFISSISPKDDEGNIKDYADFETAFETYQKLSSKEKPLEVSQRQKELSSRSMTEGGAAQPEAPKGPVTFKSINRMFDSWREQANK